MKKVQILKTTLYYTETCWDVSEELSIVSVPLDAIQRFLDDG